MRLFRKIVFLLFTLIFCINFLCLVISLVSPYINPKYFWPPALFGLFFKIFFAAHIVFTLIYLWLKERKIVAVCLAGIALSVPAISSNFAFRAIKEEYNRNETLRLMSYNCTSFGWFKNPDYDQILNNIKTADPDILCLQEYYKHTTKHHKILSFIRDELGYKHYYEYTTNIIQRSRNHVGQAFFSKIPLHNFTPIPFQEKSSNGASFIDVILKNDTIRIINIHFQSIRLKEAEYDIANIKPLADKKDKKDVQVFNSLQKFRDAFRRRSYQVSLIDSVIESSPHKVIICGDFNDTPNSFLYNKLTRNLDDTYLKTNFGIGSTFAGKIPGLRIDYIMADPQIEVARTFVYKHDGGQHYPLIGDFYLQKLQKIN